MNDIFVISDLHLGHKNMAINVRKFSSVEEHDQAIVDGWNSVVSKRDTVWVLGDVTMEKADYKILSALKGRKNVILGNHDKYTHTPELLKYVHNVCGVHYFRGIVMTHVPIHPSELEFVYKNIHGHVHHKSIPDNRYVNVCCEVVKYRPQLIYDYLSPDWTKRRSRDEV